MKRAFTLIELLVVISIIAILAALIIPTVSSAVEGAKTKQNGGIPERKSLPQAAEGTTIGLVQKSFPSASANGNYYVLTDAGMLAVRNLTVATPAGETYNISNAEELFGRIADGTSYRFRTVQLPNEKYPFIVAYEEASR